MKAKLLGAAALGLMVAACGTDSRERVTGGAAAGAATGAGVGALGGPVGALAGAAIGGGAGAVTGAVTSPDQVNLGRPVWNDPEVRVPGQRSGSGGARSAGSSQTRQLQQALSRAGHDVGPVDGIWGPRTESAVREYQRANNMDVTGRPDQRMMSALDVSSDVGTGTDGVRAGSARGERDRAYMGGGMVGGQDQRGGTGTGGAGMGGTGGTGMGGTGAPGGTGPGQGGVGGGGSTGSFTTPPGSAGAAGSATGQGGTPGSPGR